MTNLSPRFESVMVNIRCTDRLRKRMKLGKIGKLPSTGELLAEWHANLIIVDRVPLIIAVEDRTRLPLLVRARDLDRLPQRLAAGLLDLLSSIGVEPDVAEGYAMKMLAVTWSASTDQSVVATMNDYSKLAKWRAQRGEPESPPELSRRLAETPCGPIGMESPDRFTLAAIRFDPAANDDGEGDAAAHQRTEARTATGGRARPSARPQHGARGSRCPRNSISTSIA